MMNLGCEMFEGDHRDKCSVDDFITHMPPGSGSSLCQELCPEKKKNDRLRVFSYPSTSKYAGSPVEKIISYLLYLENWFKGSLMIQFWAPTIPSSGGVMLVVSGQPFAIGELCKGLCRYRYCCIKSEEDVTNTKVGPIEKVFSRGLPEYHEYRKYGGQTWFSTLSSSYKDFAESCRIGEDWNYLAVPIFGCGKADKGKVKDCVGVLEVLSYGPNYYDRRFIEESLKISGIEYNQEILGTVDNSKKTCAFYEGGLTLDMINRYCGRAKLADAAKELKVSRATLKRRCRKFGIKRWPHHKRNEVHNIQLVEVGGSVVNQEPEIRECSNFDEAGNHEIDRGYRLIVRASCRDDVAKFHFYSHSGIKELRVELDKRFELEGGRFKLKYQDEDDGEWIILSCNEDLLFHIETLKASGQSTMRLSVIPVAL